MVYHLLGQILANFKAKFYLRRITDSLFIQLPRNAKLINDLLSNVELHVRVSSPAQTDCDPRGSYSMDIQLAHCLCQGVKDLSNVQEFRVFFSDFLILLLTLEI